MSTPALRHPALEPRPGAPLLEAELTDRGRLAVLLQAVALAAHIDRVGWSLEDDWKGARVDGDGTLCNVTVSPRPGRRSVQSVAHRLLLQLFDSDGNIAGRGEGRRAGRQLVARWSTVLVPLSPDRVVGSILEAAPFLWQSRWASARRFLAAASHVDGVEGLWVAGPGHARRHLLAGATSLEQLQDRLAGDSARASWEGGGASRDPRGAAKEGRWRQAARAWARQPPSTDADRLDYARCLYKSGRVESALELLGELKGGTARVLTAWCQVYLHEYQGARNALRQVDIDVLDEEDLLEAGRVAVRLFAALAEPEQTVRWLAELDRRVGERHRWRLEVLRAEAAWDRGEPEAMGAHLEAAAVGRDHPTLGWHWYHATGLAAMSRGDGEAMEEALRPALGRYRRQLAVQEAAGLWNDLAAGRVFRDDLPAAERACAHAARLHGRTEGSRKLVLSVRNLVEVRLRRGRLQGVAELLERTLVENRLRGNVRAAAEDGTLWVRWELVQGRLDAALATCAEVIERLDAAGSDWHRAELLVLEARASGWMGRPDEAAEMLEASSDEAVATMLEPEERPAVWALAGEREKALELAAVTATEPLWEAVLLGQSVPREAWGSLESLEPYRAARLVWDWELLSPGFVPTRWVRRAVSTLRRLGARSLAERLEGRVGGAWEILASFLRLPAPDEGALQLLLAELGFGETRVLRRGPQGDEVLVSGRGGPRKITIPLPDGSFLMAQARDHDAVLEAALLAAASRLPAGTAPALPAEGPVPGIVGRSAVLAQSLAPLGALAGRDVPIMILGESGTGKELVARQIHRLSPRVAATFAPLNCAALAENLALSELFGHARGAFTGAERSHTGIFETALGGTVFLDEIGDLPMTAQGMLLRVLQEKEVRRIGESLPRPVDFRIVTATHRDLEAMVREGTFRQDLFYRLRVGVIDLPPLRNRGEDIVLLARHLIAKHARTAPPPRLSESALRSLRSHSWPGNVRELENVLQVALALAPADTIEEGHLGLPAIDETEVGGYHDRVEAFRRGLVVEALQATGGNKAAAARLLGITRQALSYLVRTLDIVV